MRPPWYLACVVAVAVSAAPAGAERRTLEGTVIDLTCYSMNEVDSGMNHVSQGSLRRPNVGFTCAYSCVRWQGMPAGLLTSDGTVYQIAGGLAADSNAKIAPHLTETVRISGDVTEVEGVLVLAADDVTVLRQ